MTKRQVLKKLREGLRIHKEWSEYLHSDQLAASLPDPRPVKEVVGATAWHDEWAAVYKRAIELIEAK